MKKGNRIKYTGIMILFIGILAACSKDPDFDQNFDYNTEFGTLPEPTYPADNKLTTEGVKLGRMLFYEKALSKNMSMSCATCHQQQNAFSVDDVFMQYQNISKLESNSIDFPDNDVLEFEDKLFELLNKQNSKWKDYIYHFSHF